MKSALDIASPTAPAENALDLARYRRQRVLWRLDGGFGTFGNLQWLLARDYQVLSKGFSSRAAHALAKAVTRWTPFDDHWIARVPCPFATNREVTVWLLRRREGGRFVYNYYVTTLRLPSLAEAMRAYQRRGGAEIEQFRNDKQGLHLSMRRKRSLVAQQALILLTDLAHNLLADFHTVALAGTQFSSFAPKRIVRDLLGIPGSLTWPTPGDLHVALQRTHPYAAALLPCLIHYCRHYDMPVIADG